MSDNNIKARALRFQEQSSREKNTSQKKGDSSPGGEKNFTNTSSGEAGPSVAKGPGNLPNVKPELPIPGLGKGGEHLKKSINDLTASKLQNNIAIRTADMARKVGAKVKQFALGMKTVGLATISALANPVTWIVLAIVVAGVYGYSSTLVIGKNEDDCAISEGSSNLNWPGDDAPIEERAKAVGCWFMNNSFTPANGKGMNANQAAALVGIMISESGLTPKKIQDDGGPGPNATNAQMKAFAADAGKYQAISMFQHTHGRAVAMIELAESTNRQWNDPAVQLEYFQKEINDNNIGQVKSLANSGFWEGGKSVEFYSDMLNRHYIVSCRKHSDDDKRPMLPGSECLNPKYLNGGNAYTVWREAGRRSVQEAEKLVPLFSNCGSGVKRGASTSSGSNPTQGATSTNINNPDKLAPHVLKYAEHIGEKFGIATIGGWREFDTYEDHPSGRALDIMIDNWDTPEGKKVGDAIAQYFIDNESAFNPIYMIWRQKWYNFENGGRPYTGKWEGPMPGRGNPTVDHYDHVHIWFNEKPGDGNWGDSGQCETNSSSTTGEWVMPTCGSISSPYGMRIHPKLGVPAFHDGFDISAPQGDDIRAAQDGVVTKAGWDVYGGNVIIIKHEQLNKKTYYAHIMPGGLLVKEGDKVKAGDLIAKVGTTGRSTGAHLHFSIYEGVDGYLNDSSSIDPSEIYKEQGMEMGVCSG